jgi:hypothetical protein
MVDFLDYSGNYSSSITGISSPMSINNYSEIAQISVQRITVSFCTEQLGCEMDSSLLPSDLVSGLRCVQVWSG